MNSYQRKLIVFLSVATFFEGFDFMLLSQVLPQLEEDFNLSFSSSSTMVSIINIGTILAFFLIRKADIWGRKKVLNITIIGYTICTGLSAFAQTAVQFTVLQLIARLFLIAEWGTAMVYAAEDFPAQKRGMVIGIIQGFASLGSIVCAGVAPLFLSSEFGWRSLYLFGIAPLILIAFARRNIEESTRFVHSSTSQRVSLFALLKGPYRNRLLLVGGVWSLSYLGFSNAVTFWKYFAMNHRGWDDAQVGTALTIAAIGSMPLVFGSGAILDTLGRKWGGMLIYFLGCLGVCGAFLFHDRIALQISLVFAIFGVSGFLPVLNSFGTELFPTKIRSEAYAWGNNILGRVGYVLAPMLIAWLSPIKVYDEPIGMGKAMASMTIFPMIAIVVIFLYFPETKKLDIDDTSTL